MDNMNLILSELLALQTLRGGPPGHPAAPWREPRDARGLRRALAAQLVRLGLRLDPAAGEGLGAFELSLAGHKGRR
jgi:hypothetical protein